MSRMLGVIVMGCLASGFVLIACSSVAMQQAQAARKVTAADAVQLMDQRTVIDVRTPAEYAGGHIVGAINIPVEAPGFRQRIDSLDREGAYLLYCRSGRRSAMAAVTMSEAGFADIVDAGGLEQLAQAGAILE